MTSITSSLKPRVGLNFSISKPPRSSHKTLTPHRRQTAKNAKNAKNENTTVSALELTKHISRGWLVHDSYEVQDHVPREAPNHILHRYLLLDRIRCWFVLMTTRNENLSFSENNVVYTVPCCPGLIQTSKPTVCSSSETMFRCKVESRTFFG